MARRFGRFVWAALSLGGIVLATPAQAAWINMATVSDTIGNTPNRLCTGAGATDIGCASTAPYLTTDGLLGIGISPTTQMEVSGTVSATRFVGDGSGLSGVTAANSDRITSGTTSMVAISSTGFMGSAQNLPKIVR